MIFFMFHGKEKNKNAIEYDCIQNNHRMFTNGRRELEIYQDQGATSS